MQISFFSPIVNAVEIDLLYEGIDLYTSVHSGINGRSLEMSNERRYKSDINLLVVLTISSEF